MTPFPCRPTVGLRYGELFAGVGGLSLGLDRAGFECAFHAEIEPFPRRVLKHRWPNVPLYGDVTELDGRKLIAECGPIDLLSGGSPCQDLSVAGKRKGMTEGSGTRSALFFEQVRLYHETEAEYLLWENVDGARSSNEGKDFACVLSALVGGTVIVPGDGWRSAGVAVGAAGIAAWRVLDAQFFGVPQRRRRVFVLCSRTGRVDPAEVLLEREGVRGDSAKGREARKDAASGTGTSVEGESGVAFRTNQTGAQGPIHSIGVTDSLAQDHPPAVLAFHHKQDPDAHPYSPPLGITADGMGVCVTGETTHALTHEGHDASEDGTGRGTPIVAYRMQRSDSYEEATVDATVASRDYKSATDLVLSWDDECNPGTDTIGTLPARAGKAGATRAGVLTGIPRRLLPIECERLMGWPDAFANVPDENGKPASDSARYRACGNGVVSHCAEWIGRELLESLRGERVA